MGEQSTRAAEAGQVDLFGMPEAAPAGAPPPPPVEMVEVPEWSESVRLQGERDTLGLFLTGHPIAEYEQDLRHLVSGRIADVASGKPVGEQRGFGGGRTVTVAGLVLEIRKRGNRTTLILDDRRGRLEVSLFDDVFQQHRDVIARDAVLLVEGQLRFDEFIEDWRLNAKRLTHIDAVREREARRIVLRWPANGNGLRLVGELEEALRPQRGGSCGVALHYATRDARAAITLGEDWSVRPTRELIERLARLVGRDGVRVVYGQGMADSG
jgi:DNA polymerase-3 subunit alpha